MTNDNSFVLTLTGLATMASEPDTNNDKLISSDTSTVGQPKNANLTGTIIFNLIFNHIFIIQKKMLKLS